MEDVSQPRYNNKLATVRPARLAKIVVDISVPPGAVVAWHVPSNCELTVRNARIWMTRAGSQYDFWLVPGEPAIHLQRGERIWLSTDSAVNADVALSMQNTSVINWLMRLGATLSF